MAPNVLRAAALASGLVFGLGLAVSGMMNPVKVIGFLDVAGNWDPTMTKARVGALLVTVPAYRFIPKRGRPMLEEGFSLPKKKAIDAPLLGGSALFGVGWGLVGFWPRPGYSRARHRSPPRFRLRRGDAGWHGAPRPDVRKLWVMPAREITAGAD